MSLYRNDDDRNARLDADIDARNAALDREWRTTPDDEKFGVYSDFLDKHNLTDAFKAYRRQWVLDGMDAQALDDAA